MYKSEIKNELYIIYNSIKKIDNELINIKVSIRNLEKLGYNMNDVYNQIDDVGIEFYKFKTMIQKNYIKGELKNEK